MSDVATDGYRVLGPTGAIPDNFVVPYYLKETKRRVSVARVSGRLYAFDDLCTCATPSCPLSGGLLEGSSIMCQCHGSRFDLATGAVVEGPATAPLVTYEVREARSEIEIRA